MASMKAGLSLVRVALASGIVWGLAGCSDKTAGSSSPPASFGALGKPLIGCPDIAGVYTWPSVDGFSYAQANRGGYVDPQKVVGVNVYPRGHFGIRLTGRGSPMTALFKSARSGAPTPRLSDREWGYSEWGALEWHCSFGYVETDEVEAEPSRGDDEPADRAGKRTVLWRLTRLADGSLALGRRTFTPGGTQAFFSWSDKSVGKVPAPDRTAWTWSKLEPVQPAKGQTD
jgi:hypothetical protein